MGAGRELERQADRLVETFPGQIRDCAVITRPCTGMGHSDGCRPKERATYRDRRCVGCRKCFALWGSSVDARQVGLRWCTRVAIRGYVTGKTRLTLVSGLILALNFRGRRSSYVHLYLAPSEILHASERGCRLRIDLAGAKDGPKSIRHDAIVRVSGRNRACQGAIVRARAQDGGLEQAQ
jgi:hypothetical protein